MYTWQTECAFCVFLPHIVIKIWFRSGQNHIRYFIPLCLQSEYFPTYILSNCQTLQEAKNLQLRAAMMHLLFPMTAAQLPTGWYSVHHCCRWHTYHVSHRDTIQQCIPCVFPSLQRLVLCRKSTRIINIRSANTVYRPIARLEYHVKISRYFPPEPWEE